MSLCAFILSIICKEFLSKYFLNFDESNDKNHPSGLGDIVIGVGSTLMALSIFVYESIARKRRYFDKYYLNEITNKYCAYNPLFCKSLVFIVNLYFSKNFLH